MFLVTLEYQQNAQEMIFFVKIIVAMVNDDRAELKIVRECPCYFSSDN